MPKFKVKEGFRNLEVGDAQVLTIKRVKYDTEFDKMVVTFADDKGRTCSENFVFVTKDGRPNDVALGIFSVICKCCLGVDTDDEIDTDDLVGCRIVADVYKQVAKDSDGNEKGTYIHLRNYNEYEQEEDDGDEDGWY